MRSSGRAGFARAGLWVLLAALTGGTVPVPAAHAVERGPDSGATRCPDGSTPDENGVCTYSAVVVTASRLSAISGFQWIDDNSSRLDHVGNRISDARVAAASPADNDAPVGQDSCTPETTANPVVIVSGNKILDQVDFVADSGFTLNRHYSKASTHVSGFGPGWTWSFGDYLTLSSPTPNFAYICKYEHPACMTPRYQAITWHRADGRSYTYTWDDATFSYVDSRPEARAARSASPPRTRATRRPTRTRSSPRIGSTGPT